MTVTPYSILIAIVGLAFFPCFLSAEDTAEILWKEDYEDARYLASKKGLPLIVWFTGSDWCVWCQKLESELFADIQFREAVGEVLIAVKVDFPRRSRLPLAIQRQNRLLQGRFAVEAFPTVILQCPKTGTVLHRHGYINVSPESYLAALRQTSEICLNSP